MKASTVLITGGNKGIGLAATEKFLQAGFHVIVVARDFATFNLKSSQVHTVEFDLAEVAQIPDLIGSLPAVDVLINNAGVMYALPYDKYPQERVDKILKINIEAPVALTREVAKSMVANRCGRIVNNASIAGQIGHPDIWYGITKAGLINMTKSFAKILGPSGVVVNAVAAGPVATEMLQIIPEQRKADIKKAVFTDRFASPQEVANTMYWLATECPEYINGTCIDINNGAFPR